MFKFPLKNNNERVMTIPKVNTAFKEGRNSSPLVPRYKIATGGPPIAAIIPKIPESVPAIKEFFGFLFTFHPKKDPNPALSTIKPTEMDKGLGSKVVKKYKPIGPPTNRPIIRNLTGSQFTFDFSRKKTLKAKGRPKSESNWGINKGFIWIIIGEAITANPKPRTPWTAAERNTRNPRKINSCRARSKGMVN